METKKKYGTVGGLRRKLEAPRKPSQEGLQIVFSGTLKGSWGNNMQMKRSEMGEVFLPWSVWQECWAQKQPECRTVRRGGAG